MTTVRTLFLAALLGTAALAQPPDSASEDAASVPEVRAAPAAGPMGQTRKILDQFDKEKKGYLNAAERKAAREYLATQPQRGFGRGGFGRGGGAARSKWSPVPSCRPTRSASTTKSRCTT